MNKMLATITGVAALVWVGTPPPWASAQNRPAAANPARPSALSKLAQFRTWNYVGTTSQVANRNGDHPTFLLHLQTQTGGGYSLTARWGAKYYPANPCSGYNASRLAASHVPISAAHMFSIARDTDVLPASPGHVVTNFTAQFTRGKVSGSFTDSWASDGTPCSTGVVTFSAHSY